jgi:hypothetical protein
MITRDVGLHADDASGDLANAVARPREYPTFADESRVPRH